MRGDMDSQVRTRFRNKIPAGSQWKGLLFQWVCFHVSVGSLLNSLYLYKVHCSHLIYFPLVKQFLMTSVLTPMTLILPGCLSVFETHLCFNWYLPNENSLCMDRGRTANQVLLSKNYVKATVRISLAPDSGMASAPDCWIMHALDRTSIQCLSISSPSINAVVI